MEKKTPMNDEQLCALLRLKRFEQPPEGYFDGLLRDIHRRQREELLRRSLWSIAMERMQTFFGEHSMSSPAYAGAMAAVLVAGVVTIGTVLPHSHAPGGGVIASATPAPVSQSQADKSLAHIDVGPGQDLYVSQGALFPPRYIMDARPVSYDASSITSF